MPEQDLWSAWWSRGGRLCTGSVQSGPLKIGHGWIQGHGSGHVDIGLSRNAGTGPSCKASQRYRRGGRDESSLSMGRAGQGGSGQKGRVRVRISHLGGSAWSVICMGMGCELSVREEHRCTAAARLQVWRVPSAGMGAKARTGAVVQTAWYSGHDSGLIILCTRSVTVST